MNKRELIEHINNTLFDKLKDTLFTEPTCSITENAKDNKATITFETEQGGVLVGGMLKKFEKVTVPQFVADYIEFKKKYDFHVYGAMREIEDHYDKRVPEWFYENNIETFVRAWLDGYEVEKEKRYRVKAKGVCFNSCLIFEKVNKKWLFSSIYETDHQRGSHTRKQLEEAGFGEVFNSPLFEVEEVE